MNDICKGMQQGNAVVLHYYLQCAHLFTYRSCAPLVCHTFKSSFFSKILVIYVNL